MTNFLIGILELSVGGALLILLLLLTLRLFGKKFTAKCRYILWILVMLRLAVPFSTGLLPALIEVPVENLPAETEPAPTIPPSAPILTDTHIPPVTAWDIPENIVPSPVYGEPTPPPTQDETPIPETSPADILATVYLTGTAVFFLWNMTSYLLYTGKIRKHARSADREEQKILETVCKSNHLHTPPALLIAPGIHSPAAFGLFRRYIVLPDIGFTENGLTGTLAHEVTHCKRGDLYIKFVALLARSLHWFNPLVHVAAFRCEMEMELSCDESVLRGCDDETRTAYGEVMLDIIRRCRRNRGALTTHFNPRKTAVTARFKNILYGSGKNRGYALIGICVVLCLLAGTIVACQTETDENPPEDIPEVTEIPETPAASDTLEEPILSELPEIMAEESPHPDISQAFLTVSMPERTAVYYFYAPGLTYYRYTPHDGADYKCTLVLPAGYEDGEIFHASANPENDTIQITVQTSGGYLAYTLASDSFTPTSVEILTKPQVSQIMDSMTAHYTTVYRCDDVYRTDQTPTYGTAAVSVPTAMSDYVVDQVSVLLCDDGCDPTDVLSRAIWGYAPGWRIDQYTEYTETDGWNYPTRAYENIVPDDIKASMMEQGTPEWLYDRREYPYLLTLDETHYAVIVLKPKSYESEKPTNERERVDDILKTVRIDTVWWDGSAEEPTTAQDYYRALLNDEIGHSALLYNNPAVSADIADMVATVLNAYRNGQDPNDLLPASETTYIEYPLARVRENPTVDEITELLKDAYVSPDGTISLNLDLGAEGYVMTLPIRVGQFGESYAAYFTGIEFVCGTPKLLSIVDIENYAELGDSFYPSYYEYTKAFLTGDTATMEEIGNYPSGTLTDYKKLKIGDYFIYRDDSTDQFLLEAEILTGTEGIPAGTRRFLYTEYPGIGLTLLRDDTSPVSEAGTALSRLLNITMQYDLTAMKSVDFTTEYLIDCLSSKAGRNSFSADEITAYANLVFGWEDFAPSPNCFYDGTYTIPGHGAAHTIHDIASTEEHQNDNGTAVTTVTVRFYADRGMTVYSHMIAYDMEKSGEDWIFREQRVLEERPYPPCRYAT